MKRDLDLIRKLLLLAEEKANQKGFFIPTFDGHTPAEINYHLELLQQANFANTQRIATGTVDIWKLGALTWDGQEFLANAKNDTFWKKSMKLVKSKGGSASLEVVKMILENVAKSYFQVDG